MRNVALENPRVLWLLLVAVAAVAILSLASRAVGGGRGRLLLGAVRSLWIALCVLALARPVKVVVETLVERPRVVVAVDRSQSVSADLQAIELKRGKFIEALGPHADVRPIEFAAEPWATGAPPELGQTNIEKALDAANRQNTDSANCHLVLVSDARETAGDAVAAATRAAGRGAVVSVLPVGTPRAAAPRITRVEPPVGLKVGVETALRVTLASDEPIRGVVRLRDPAGRVVDERALPLAGRSTLLLHFTPREKGAAGYQVELERMDGAGGGNAGAAARGIVATRPALVYVEGPPRLLVCDSFPEEAGALKKALEPLKLPIDVIAPAQWPLELGQYAAVVISDFSGRELSAEQRGALKQYVEQGGGGLVFIAGGNVVPTRWTANPLAHALPFVMREPPAKVVAKAPDVSICYVIDRSGSMNQPLMALGAAAPTSKLELVKAAIQASIQSLPESAHVAVVAFGGDADIAVPPTPIAGELARKNVADQVDQIGIGGGTAMATGIDEGLRQLAGMPGDKYIVVLTDGESQPPALGSWEDRADRARTDKVSWTSIAVGTTADQRLLRSMAARAGGTYHYCGTADSVPQVFIEQAKAVGRVVDKPSKMFRPAAGPAAAKYRGPPIDELPELAGAVLTVARPATDVILVGEQNAPLLAAWQFGLGRVVAFASDAKTAWAARWVTWDGFAPFWQSLVGGVLRVSQEYAVSMRTRVLDKEALFVFRVRDKDDRPVAGLSPTSQWLQSDYAGGKAVRWTQSRPGEYEASVPRAEATALKPLLLSLDGPGGQAVRYCAYLPEPPRTEADETGPDLAAAQAIAEAGRGIVAADVESLARFCGVPRTRDFTIRKPLWPWLIAAAVLLWPIDIVVRRSLA